MTGSSHRLVDFLMKNRAELHEEIGTQRGSPSSRLIRMKTLVHENIVQKSEILQGEQEFH